jgi:hypothetical protein
VRLTAAAHETFGVWRQGQYDDLVLAVALACWWAERQPRGGADAFGAAAAWCPRTPGGDPGMSAAGTHHLGGLDLGQAQDPTALAVMGQPAAERLRVYC